MYLAWYIWRMVSTCSIHDTQGFREQAANQSWCKSPPNEGVSRTARRRAAHISPPLALVAAIFFVANSGIRLLVHAFVIHVRVLPGTVVPQVGRTRAKLSSTYVGLPTNWETVRNCLPHILPGEQLRAYSYILLCGNVDHTNNRWLLPGTRYN